MSDIVTSTSEDEAADGVPGEAPPTVRTDVYISADIEADGPIPGPFSMLSLGMCIAGEQDQAGTFWPIQPESARFYRELRPISDRWEPGALEAISSSGLDRDRLLREGADPAVAMTEAARWVTELARGRRPVFVGWPMGYDWMFLQWYFHSFSEVGSPFGFSSALDMKTMLYVGTHRVLDELGKDHLPTELVPDRPHTHHALDDAVEQAELFQNLRRWRMPPLPEDWARGLGPEDWGPRTGARAPDERSGRNHLSGWSAACGPRGGLESPVRRGAPRPEPGRHP